MSDVIAQLKNATTSKILHGGMAGGSLDEDPYGYEHIDIRKQTAGRSRSAATAAAGSTTEQSPNDQVHLYGPIQLTSGVNEARQIGESEYAEIGNIGSNG